MKADTYGECLRQFAQAVDYVTETTFDRVLDLIADYAHKTLGFGYFEFMTPQPVNGEDGLQTLYIYQEGSRKDGTYATEIFEPGQGQKPKTQSALAHVQKSPLWIVSKERKSLRDCDGYEDQWSQQTDLPRYNPIAELVAKTSVILPVYQGRRALGAVDFEGEAYIPYSRTTSEELEAIVACVAQLWFLNQALEAQSRGTEEALDYLNDTLASGAFPDPGISKLFLAYPRRAKPDILRIIKTTLYKDEFKDCIKVVDWRELDKPGNVTIELLEHIARCRFGLCYFSEEIPGETNRFRDNANVLFEAGMLHALTNQPAGPPRGWIPIREEGSSATPFDFAQERTILISRDKQGEICGDVKKEITDRLRGMLRCLLETR